jgi:hypothetical protein
MTTTLPSSNVQVRDGTAGVSYRLRPQWGCNQWVFLGCFPFQALPLIGLSVVAAAAARELFQRTEWTWSGSQIFLGVLLILAMVPGPPALIFGLLGCIRLTSQIEIVVGQGLFQENRKWGPFRRRRVSIHTDQIIKLASNGRSICLTCEGGATHRIAEDCGFQAVNALLDDFQSRLRLPVEPSSSPQPENQP